MAFVDRQRKSRERNRPAVNFTQRDDVREFAGSGIGRNYNRMMDLQSQKDPNLQDLKQARRQYGTDTISIMPPKCWVEPQWGRRIHS